jgi:hypothetical protein
MTISIALGDEPMNEESVFRPQTLNDSIDGEDPPDRGRAMDAKASTRRDRRGPMWMVMTMLAGEGRSNARVSARQCSHAAIASGQ